MYNQLNVNNERPLLVLAVTAAISMNFFKGQIDFFKKEGFDIAVVCSPGWDNIEGVKYYPIAMEREIAVLKDIRSLYLLVRLFHKIKPTIVNAGTPKAGMLVGIAAFISRVPIRIYTCHGLRFETLIGWKQTLLTVTEKVTSFCATKIVCVSKSLRRKFIESNLAHEDKVLVLGDGSCNGIDLNKFNIFNQSCSSTDFIKKGQCIKQDAIFIGFIGRLTKDKGVYEIIGAFEILKKIFPHLYLLLLGGFEEGDPVSEKIKQKIIRDERIINLGFITETVPYYQMMKILVLPTYREGLPTVLLEAGAMGIPVVATRATGCVDVVVDGETGLLVPVGDSTALANAVKALLVDEALATTIGQKARKRIEQLYNQEVVWNNIAEFYKSQLVTGQLSRFGGVTDGHMKRVIDLCLSSFLFIVLSPVLLFVYIIIRTLVGSPVFFRQKRPGLQGKPFHIYKFRTMTDERDSQGNLLPDEKRLTKIGVIMRKLSIDELPQLINVIKGELSLVGPRPLLMEYLPLYTAEQIRRHDVKPGISGWAQVNGRNELSWEEKFRLDVWYVDNRSFWLDLKIIWLTVLKVVTKVGISQQGHVTVEKYKGNEQCQDY